LYRDGRQCQQPDECRNGHAHFKLHRDAEGTLVGERLTEAKSAIPVWAASLGPSGEAALCVPPYRRLARQDKPAPSRANRQSIRYTVSSAAPIAIARRT
jgi:hypothetical protein